MLFDFSSYQKMQIKTIRFYFLPVSKNEKGLIIPSIDEGMQKQIFCCLCISVQLFGRAVWQFLSKFKVFRSFYMASLLLPSFIKCFYMCIKIYIQGYCSIFMQQQKIRNNLNANQKGNSYINYVIAIMQPTMEQF